MNQIIEFQGRMLVLKRTIKESTLKDGSDLNLLKELYRCDTLLRKDGRFYFCDSVTDIEFTKIIEEENISEE